MKPSLVLSQTRTGFEQSQGSGSWEHWDQGDGILQLLQGHSGLRGGRKQSTKAPLPPPEQVQRQILDYL